MRSHRERTPNSSIFLHKNDFSFLSLKSVR